MKVFGCTRHGGYAGGIILVAANSLDEAISIFTHSDKLDYLCDWTDSEGCWAEPGSPGATCSSDDYPLDEWREYEHLSCDFTEPQVILHESYAE